MDLRLEVVVLPVTDVDKAKQFYETGLACRLDADVSPTEGYRVVQVTPPGSACSIIFGDGVTSARPGTGGSLMLVVDYIAAAGDGFVSRGVDVSEIFHAAGGGYGAGFDPGIEGRAPGPDPQGLSYATFASFSDPDGNSWLLQEITDGSRAGCDHVTDPTDETSDVAALAELLHETAEHHGTFEAVAPPTTGGTGMRPT